MQKKSATITFILFLFLLIITFELGAQQTQDDKRHLYSISERLYKNDEQVFRPIDGAEVKMIPFRVDKLYGFVDKVSKKEIIKPQYIKVWEVTPYGAVVEDEKAGIYFITNEGKRNSFNLQSGLFRTEHYGSLTSFHCGDSNVYDSDASAVCLYYGNKKFDILFNETVHDYKSFLGTDSLAWFRYGEDIRIRNYRGDTLRTLKYDKEKTFMGICNNLLVFKTMSAAKDTMYYTAYEIDDKLIIRIPVDQSSMRGPYRLSERIFAFDNQDGELFFADDGGLLNYGTHAENIGFDYYEEGFNYQRYYSIHDYDTRLYGVVDSDARVQIQFTYNYIGPFSNGFMQYRDSIGYGFMNLDERKIPINTSGDYLLTLNYLGVNWHFSDDLLLLPPYNYNRDSYTSDENGKATLAKTEPFRFLDTNGKVAITLTADYWIVGNFNDGLAPVITKDREVGFINTSGKLVIPTKYKIGDLKDEEIGLLIPSFRNGYAYLVSQKGYIDKNGIEYFKDTEIKKEIKSPIETTEKKSVKSKEEKEIMAPLNAPIIPPPRKK